MPEPSYDFFATGRPAAEPPIPGGHAMPPAGPAPVTNQFGTPAAAAASAPAPAAFTVAPASGYAPGAVNNFGTPLDVVASPTGPFAAPGIAVGPIDAPGMVSTWGGPAQPGRAAHAAPTAPGADVALPRNVRAVAILGLFFGGLMGLATLWAFSQYSQISAAVGSLSDGDPRNPVAATALGALVFALVLLAASTLFLLVGGTATLANRRWGGWMLVVAFGLYLLGQVRQLGETGPQAIPLLTAGIALALFLALVTGEGQRWLMRR